MHRMTDLPVGRFTPASATYPTGSIKNETVAGANDGSPYNLDRNNDEIGIKAALVGACGITPSGAADNANDSQVVQAIIEEAMGRAQFFVEDGGSAADAYVVTPATVAIPIAPAVGKNHAPQSYFGGMMVAFDVAAPNTGPATINVAGLGVKSIFRPGIAAPLQAGDVSGRVFLIFGVTAFTLLRSGAGIFGLNFTATTQVRTDSIVENLTGNGVTVEGVLLKDSIVRVNDILEKTGNVGVTIDGVLIKDGVVETDDMTEKTGAAGVTIETTLHKDGYIVPGTTIGGGTPVQDALYTDNICKAWVNFDGTGVLAVRDSFNVSSVTDGGVGDYTVNWDRDFSGTGYSVLPAGGQSAIPRAVMFIVTMLVGSVRVQAEETDAGAANKDLSIVNLHAFGSQ